MQAKDLSQLLAQRALEIAQMLFPNGRKEGNKWCVGSILGDAGKSMKICLSGTKAGIWCDFADGMNGDLLDLWAIKNHISISKAMSEVREYLNIKDVKPSYGVNKKTFVKPPKRHLESIKSTSPIHTYLTETRALKSEILSLYDIPHSDTEIIFNYVRDDELIFVKSLALERKDGKKKMYVESGCEPCLFGWQQVHPAARKVIICEGEIDAMSFAQYGFSALSVPFGGGKNQAWIEYEFDRLNRFDEIFVCMDNDKVGIEGSKEIVERLGAHRCRIVELPFKDANECLVNNVSIEKIEECLNSAKSLDPSELKTSPDFTTGALELLNPSPGKFIGYTLGFKKCGERFVFRPSGLTLWTGFNGHGKSIFLNQIMINMIKQGAKVCIASMELTPEELMARTYVQMTAQPNPSLGFALAVNDYFDGHLYIFDLVGTGKIDRLLEVFLYARKRYGVDVFIVDSLTTLNIAEDDYNAQKHLTEMLRDFKLLHKCHIHLVAHPRKPRDEKEIPGKYDIRGAGAISDLADNCFSVWRNKQKHELIRQQNLGANLTVSELEILQKPDALLRCDKNRHSKEEQDEGTYGFWFNKKTLRFTENPSDKIKPYVEYSCLKDN